MIFAQKEVHVVELHRVGAVAFDQMCEDGNCSLGRLHFLFVAISCMHSAEAAVEGTTDTGMMYGGALAEEGWAQSTFDRNTVKGDQGNSSGPFIGRSALS